MGSKNLEIGFAERVEERLCLGSEMCPSVSVGALDFSFSIDDLR